MFADELCFHERKSFELVVVDCLDDGVLGLAEESLVHVLYLVL